jgi:hypothetical protein
MFNLSAGLRTSILKSNFTIYDHQLGRIKGRRAEYADISIASQPSLAAAEESSMRSTKLCFSLVRPFLVYKIMVTPDAGQSAEIYQYFRQCNLIPENSSRTLHRVISCKTVDIIVTCKYGSLNCSGVPRNFFRGGSTNADEDRGQRERGSGGGGSPLVRGSGVSCNLVQQISCHIVNVS